MIPPHTIRLFARVDIAFLGAILLAWAAWSFFSVTRQGTWLDETTYVIKSWWYITGVVTPYSAKDSTGYLPLHYYAVGMWQSLFGNDIVASRLWSTFLTAINIALIAFLLRRFGCSVWTIAIAIMVFALNEESMFYFSSVTPYALAVCLQLVCLHFLIDLDQRPGYRRIAGLALGLTLIYMLRPDLSIFIALALGTIIYRSGWAAVRVIAAVGVVFLAIWGICAAIWGARFIYVSTLLPGLSDGLMKMGLLLDLYPNALRYAQHLTYSPPRDFVSMFRSAMLFEIHRDWIGLHHLAAVVSAGFAAVVAAVPRIRGRRWLAYFTAAYWGGLLYYLIAGQLQCNICVQAYLNYIDYLAAVAGGLALHALSERASSARGLIVLRSAAIATVAVVVAVQGYKLDGTLGLPSAFRVQEPLPSQVNRVKLALADVVPKDKEIAVIGTDNRLILGLASTGARIAPWVLGGYDRYRIIQPNLGPGLTRQTADEIEAMGNWSDSTVVKWLNHSYDDIVVQNAPAITNKSPWTPTSVLVKGALARCFRPERTFEMANMTPPLQFTAYRRIKSGVECAQPSE